MPKCYICGKTFWKKKSNIGKSIHDYCSRKCAVEGMRKRYTVYNNHNETPVIVNGTAKECAKAMGIKPTSFHAIRCKCNAGVYGKWTVIDESEEEECSM